MATLSSTKVSSAALLAMPGVGDGQSAKVMSSVYNLTGATAANDIILSPLIQSGSVITDVSVIVEGNIAGTVDVGYGGDPDYWIAAGATGTNGAYLRANAITAVPLVLTENDTVDVIIKTAAGAPATSGRVFINVTFLPRNA